MIMSGTWLREWRNMKQKFKHTITLWNTIWCACQRKKISPSLLEKKKVCSLHFSALNFFFKCLLDINGIVSSFLRIKKFPMCTNYFRLLLGNTGESLTFLHLFKFNHWNKHLKTDSSESINKPSMKAPNRRPELPENCSTLAGKRYRSSLSFLVKRQLSLAWTDEVTNTWTVWGCGGDILYCERRWLWACLWALPLRHLLGSLASWDAEAGVRGVSLTALPCQLQHLVSQDHWGFQSRKHRRWALSLGTAEQEQQLSSVHGGLAVQPDSRHRLLHITPELPLTEAIWLAAYTPSTFREI